MKKIGIITIPDYDNYGNRLQNYAVKCFFEIMGYTVHTLEMNDIEFPQYRARKFKLILRKMNLRPVIMLFERLHGGKLKARRYKNFENFTRKYLSVRYFPDYSKKVINRICKEYDYIVLGSDQIWHPTVNKTPNLFFGKFMSPSRVLYFAPSFGLETLPKSYEEVVVSGLKDAQNITVREETGAKLIQNLLNKEATVLPDPTMVLTAEEWKRIAKIPICVKDKKYILKYFLGKVNEVYKEEIERISKDKDISIFEIANNTIPQGYTIGPDEFLGSILNAEFILTDSFHAVVFSILFHKPFIVFSRLDENGENAGIDSRIDNLLKKFGLQDKKYNGVEKIDYGTYLYIGTDSILKKQNQMVTDFFQKFI